MVRRSASFSLSQSHFPVLVSTFLRSHYFNLLNEHTCWWGLILTSLHVHSFSFVFSHIVVLGVVQ
jgi:hypothetical protein